MGRGGPRGPGGPMGMLPMVGSRLGLTAAQNDQVKNIAESHKGEWKAIAEFVQVLTADQKAPLKTMQAEMKKRMKGRGL